MADYMLDALDRLANEIQQIRLLMRSVRGDAGQFNLRETKELTNNEQSD